MTAIFSPTFLLSHTSKLLFPSRLTPSQQPVIHRTLIPVKCSSSGQSETSSNDSNNMKDALSGLVNSQVDELLNREENRALLEGLEQATRRVENAKRELAEIERQELEAKQMRKYVSYLEARASEIAECQKEISEAKAKLEQAEWSLSVNADNSTSMGDESGEINRDEERLESVKAASISALLGTLVGLPIYFSQATTVSELILPVATTFVSCALFGVTFRYVIRRDLDDFQLKTGASAAFGVVKGLATLAGGPPLEVGTESILAHAATGVLYVSENLFICLFAAVGIDFCFKMGFLSTFPIKRSASRPISR